MTLVTWAALTCLGLAYAEPVQWVVVAGWRPNALVETSEVLPLEVAEFVVPLTPEPGQVLYVRVRAVDAAGNRSGDECAQD